MNHQQGWRACSVCKKMILNKGNYFECSVSTCTGKRTGYVFCSIPCWEAHLPEARHKNAYAIEETAPASGVWSPNAAPEPILKSQSKPQTAQVSKQFAQPARTTTSVTTSIGENRKVIISKPVNEPTKVSSPIPRDILIVASKLKDYVKARADMNTSAGVFDALSDIVRELCDEAIDKARQDGRKTLMDRDF